jgi:transposase
MIAEGEMISMEEREMIRRPYFLEKKSIRQLAQEVNRSRFAVRKAIASAEMGSYTLKEPRPAPALGLDKERINELLAENERLPRKQRYTGHKIHKTFSSWALLVSDSIAQQEI